MRAMLVLLLAACNASPGGVCIGRDDDTRRVLATAAERPPWVELSTGLELASADVAHRDAIRERLQAIGARNISGSSVVWAIVHARDVAEMPCWPNVLHVHGDAPASSCTPVPYDPDGGVVDAGPESCVVECPVVAGACPDGCNPIRGYRIDRARGCAVRDALLACTHGFPWPTADLTCYVQERTGDVYAVGEPYLVNFAFTGLHLCSRAEGGPTSPLDLPSCP